MMKKFLFGCSDELFKAIEAARGSDARNPMIETLLWRCSAIRKAAKKIGVENPNRKAYEKGGAK